MFAAQVELKKAEATKRKLLKEGVLNPDYKPLQKNGYLYFPLIKKIKGVKTVEVSFRFPQKEKQLTVKDLLKGKLTPAEIKLIPHSQEILGKIMILEIPEEFEKKENTIAQAYLDAGHHIDTVVKKNTSYTGVFRTRKIKVLAGKKTKETVHNENGVKIMLHLEDVYFSARSSNERLRIAKLTKKGEEVLIMFSGAAPYPLVIAKHSEAKKIYGVELNPDGHRYAEKNVRLNKFENRIVLYDGDVRKVVPKLKKKFDRIAMPLPKTSEEFLDVALAATKKGGTIHLYTFLNEEKISEEAKRVKKRCHELGYQVRIIRKVKCGQFSPGIFRICFDIKVE
ncbi:MAG: class I SAM-dependent methyltransferase family protein [archaeon]|nr:class I SAM-dependent methyltransferase family protein [archaeon]